MSGGRPGAFVGSPSSNNIVAQMMLAVSRPIKIASDVLSMAQDAVGRIRVFADINSGTVTTVSTVTTVTTVSSLTNINSQNAQNTLLYGVELGTWANLVRSRIS